VFSAPEREATMTDNIVSAKPKFHPIDVTTLKKGDWLSPEQCENIHGVLREEDPSGYAFANMSLRNKIEALSVDADYPFSCGHRDDGIRILTDAEALEEQKKRMRESIRKVKRARRLSDRNDLNNLTPEQRREWERERIRTNVTLDSMKEINRGRMPQFPPRKKNTPNVLDGSVKKRVSDPADLLPGRKKI
jgi:hypothetical protein